MKTKRTLTIFSIVVMLCICILGGNGFAVTCVETDSICTQGKSKRIIEGNEVEADCWQYSFKKSCDFPSKQNCGPLQSNKECFLISESNCLLHDDAQRCVNILREYSCNMEAKPQKTKKFILKGKDASKSGSVIKCLGLPDFKVAETSAVNNEMGTSIAKLNSMMHFKNLAGFDELSASTNLANHKVMGGNLMHCNKNMLAFSNCCTKGGWGQDMFGAKCSETEKNLSTMRDKKLCHYVGKKEDKVLGITVNFKHYFCCWNSSLERIVQTDPAGRISLRGFGMAEEADCSGLTLNELSKIDWNNIDFSDFEGEMIQKLQIGKPSDTSSRIENSLTNSIKSFEAGNIPSFNDSQKAKVKDMERYHE